MSELDTIKAYVLQGGPKTYSESLAWRHLCETYPDDVRRIQAELTGQAAPAVPPAPPQPIDELAARRLRRRRP